MHKHERSHAKQNIINHMRLLSERMQCDYSNLNSNVVQRNRGYARNVKKKNYLSYAMLEATALTTFNSWICHGVVWCGAFRVAGNNVRHTLSYNANK